LDGAVLMQRSKVCFKCLTQKPIDDFYKHPQMGDGHLNKCKECAKKDVKADYRADPLKHRAREKKRFQDPVRRAMVYGYTKKQMAEHPEKRLAHSRVAYAVRTGKLVKQPCERCGASKLVQAHHDDYSKPLEVRWLCFPCHRIHHGQTVLPVLHP